MNTLRKPFHRTRSQLSFEGRESKTDTSFGNDTDVNNIVARFARTGQLPPPQGQPQYADVTGLQQDLTTIIQKGKDAQKELDKHQRENDKQKQKQNDENAKQAKEFKAFKAQQEQQQQQEQSSE